MYSPHRGLRVWPEARRDLLGQDFRAQYTDTDRLVRFQLQIDECLDHCLSHDPAVCGLTPLNNPQDHHGVNVFAPRPGVTVQQLAQHVYREKLKNVSPYTD